MSSKELIPVAYYHELGCEDAPMVLRLADSRGRRPPDHKAEVIAYLSSAPWKVYAMSPGCDCFDAAKEVDLTTVTDGTYEWPRALAYYVEHYDVHLPPTFEAHMAANQWRIPEGINTRTLKIRPFAEPTADDLAALASELARAGRVAEAAAAYRRVLGAHPSHPRSLDDLRAILRSQDRRDEVIEILGTALADDPRNASVWFHRGVAVAERAKQHAAASGSMNAIAQVEAALNDLRRAAALGHAEAAAAVRDLSTEEGKAKYDEADFRYMLHDEDRGLVHGLHETGDGWGLGGPLLIGKRRPVVLDQAEALPLVAGSHFYKQWFELSDTGARGWALVLERTPTSLFLAGWVRPEQEQDATRWLDFLNQQIEQRLLEPKPPIDPDEHARRSIALFRSLGIAVPEADTMDELMTKLKAAAAADAPIVGNSTTFGEEDEHKP